MAVWTRTIVGISPIVDRMHGDMTQFKPCRDEIVALLKKDPAYDDEAEFGSENEQFTEAVEELAYAENEGEFDGALAYLYDWADDNRVWIDPHK